MTAIIEARPRIPRLAMVFIAAVVVMLLTAPKAFAWSETVGDFKIEKPYSSYGSSEVTVKEYTGNGRDITLPSTVTYKDTEYTITAVGSNVLKKLAGTEGIDLTVTIPEGYTTIKGEAFKNCYGLKTITIPGSVTEINYNAFDGCKNLASVNFAASTQSKLTFGIKTFLGCTALNHLELPARVTSVDAGSFQGCTSLTDLTVADGCAAYVAQDGTLFKKNDDNSYTLHTYAPASTATSYTVPESVNSLPVTSIFRMAFQNNANLTSVTVPAAVTDFQPYAFDNCTNLKKISIAADSVTLSNSCFTGLPEGSVIEVANDTVKDAFEPSKTSYGTTETHYTAGNTTVQVKGASAPQTSSAELTAKGTGVKDGYAYYKLTLDNAENVKTMLLHLSFDASKVSKDAQVEGKKDAYVELNDDRFSLVTVNWTEADGKVDAKILLIPKDNGEAISGTDAANLLLVGLPVKAGVTGDIAMTVSAECAGVVSTTPTNGTVTVNGSPASNRIANYDVYEDGKINILDITEAQRFYQVSSSDTDNWSVAQKADVNADGRVDIQDLIDIFLQIKF